MQGGSIGDGLEGSDGPTGPRPAAGDLREPPGAAGAAGLVSKAQAALQTAHNRVVDGGGQ